MNIPSEPGSGHPGDPLDPMTLVHRVAELDDNPSMIDNDYIAAIIDQARAIQREYDPVEPDYTAALPF